MITREAVAAVLDRVRPFVQADGGDLHIVDVEGDNLAVCLTGRCAGCPSAQMTLHFGVEQALRLALPAIRDIRLADSPSDALRHRPDGRRVMASAASTAREEPDVVVGRSARMRGLHEFLRVIGPSDSTVLVTGESGTGKEVTAATIHRASRRRARPFVAVSCALLSETLIESDLFGHERGAFTNAVRDRPGRFELAEGGTLFLDDIDDIPLGMQVKLLRVLQNRTVERLGGTRPTPVNVRIIAATKHDLNRMVAAGTFREDLFYRLNVLPIKLPPLRERREDIPDLVQHFFARASRRRSEVMPVIPDIVLQAFLRYDWPGNVRELENACERIVQTCFCGTVGAGCLSFNMLAHNGQDFPLSSSTPIVVTKEVTSIDLDERLHELESTLLDWALGVSGGNKSRAAELLTIRRSTFADRLKRCQQVDAASSSRAAATEETEPLPLV